MQGGSYETKKMEKEVVHLLEWIIEYPGVWQIVCNPDGKKQGHLLIETVLTVQKTSVQLPEAPEVKEQQKWMTVTMTGNVKVEDTEAIPEQMHRMTDRDQILAGQDPEELRQEAGSVVRILMTGTWKQMMKNWILTEQIIGENAYDGENEQMVVCT